jgi:hypothetical protein
MQLSHAQGEKTQNIIQNVVQLDDFTISLMTCHDSDREYTCSRLTNTILSQPCSCISLSRCWGETGSEKAWHNSRICFLETFLPLSGPKFYISILMFLYNFLPLPVGMNNEDISIWNSGKVTL